MMLKINNVSKKFDAITVLNDISLELDKGQIYGLLGENGAGKTTLMKSIVGLTSIDQGEILVSGKDVSKNIEILNSIGAMIETPVFYEYLTATENLALHCMYKGAELSEIDRTLEIVEMMTQKNKKVKKMSLGMKQRLGIARALIGFPKMLILDEPINGLDPRGIKEMRLMFKEIAKSGTSILISSHILSEIESISDTIGFMHEGNLIREIQMKEYGLWKNFYVTVGGKFNKEDIQKRIDSLSDECIKNSGMTETGFILKSLNNSSIELATKLQNVGITVVEIIKEENSLEELYMQVITKKEAA